MTEERKMDPVARSHNRRRIYVNYRLPIITQELGQLRTEREKVQLALKSAGAAKKAELRKRNTYLAVRMEILRQEKKSMVEERESLKVSRG